MGSALRVGVRGARCGFVGCLVVIAEADEHFRERLAEFFRRYPYDEWYPLEKAEFAEYKKSYPETEPREWQKESPISPAPTTTALATSQTVLHVGSTATYTAAVAPSLLGVLLCGLAIAWLTGAFRLPDRRARWRAFGLSLAGPVLLTVGMLAAAW